MNACEKFQEFLIDRDCGKGGWPIGMWILAGEILSFNIEMARHGGNGEICRHYPHGNLHLRNPDMEFMEATACPFSRPKTLEENMSKQYAQLNAEGIVYVPGGPVKIIATSGSHNLDIVDGENGLAEITFSTGNMCKGTVFAEIRDGFINGFGLPGAKAVLSADGRQAELHWPDGDVTRAPVYPEESALKIVEANRPFELHHFTLMDELYNRGISPESLSLEEIQTLNEELQDCLIRNSIDDNLADAINSVMDDLLDSPEDDQPVPG